MSHPSLRRLLALTGLALPGIAFANSGSIDFVSGNVTAQSIGSPARALTKGAEVRSGDTVRTNDGMVQIRYPDGAYVSLRPDTEYTIESYRFDGKTDGSEQGLFKLVKGTMRTVTGLVGRINRAAYRITTPTATIGIRGTGGVIAVNSTTGATTIIGTSGTWDLKAETGPSIPVSAGQTGRTTSTTQPAQQVSSTPGESRTSTPAQQTTTTRTEYSSSEDRTSTGTASSVSSDKTYSSISFAIAGASGSVFATQNASIASGSTTVKATVDGTGALTGYEKTSPGFTEKVTISGGGTLVQSGTEGPFVWGRIVNAKMTSVVTHSSTSTSTTTVGANGGISFTAGEATFDMPKSGTFTYNLVPGAATRPSFKSESTVPASVNSGHMTGVFTPSGGSVSINMGLSLNSQTYTLNASGTITNSGFSTSGSTTGGVCTSSCSSFVNGGFAGSGAPYASGAYQITLPGDTVNGVAIFKKQ